MDNNQILINKYRKSDLITKNDFVIFIGKDYLSSSVRIEPRNRKTFVYKSMVADYGDYVYIPDDKCPKSQDGFIFINPIKSQYLSKLQWKYIKNTHPLNGEKEL